MGTNFPFVSILTAPSSPFAMLWDGWDSPTPSEEKISCSPLCFWNCGGPDLVPQIWVLALRSDQPLWRIFGFPYGTHWIQMKASCGGDNNGNKLQLDVDHGLSTHLHKRIDRFPHRGCFSAALCILFSISVNFETDESFVLFGLRMFFYFLKVKQNWQPCLHIMIAEWAFKMA